VTHFMSIFYVECPHMFSNKEFRQTMVTVMKRFPLWLCLLPGLMLLTACSSTPNIELSGPIFYPPLPNAPRIQYLATFSSPKDINGETGAFADFVLGSEEKYSDLVQKPYGVAVYDGKIFVVDTRGPGYAVLDLVKKRSYMVSGFGSGRMSKPINITIDKQGNRYISDTGRKQILMFDKKDKFIKAFGVKDQFKPSDVAFIGDKMFIADLQHQNILVLDKNSGDNLYSIGSSGSGKENFFFPTNIEYASDGYLYISDTGNFRIQKVTPEGKFVRSFGSVGTGLGHFARPKGVAVDHNGVIYVVDAAFENVQVLDKEGRVLLYFASAGGAPDSINLPTDIEIDYDNVALFQKYADPKFKLEYVLLVASQFGRNKVNVYGYGKMQGMDYTIEEK